MASTETDLSLGATARWASSRLGFVGVALVCLALAFALRLGFSDSDASRAAGLTIVVALVTIGVLRRERRHAGRAGLVSPISLFFVFWLAYIFVAGLGEFGAAGNDPLLPGGTHELLVAYAVSAAALVLVAVGYYVAIRGCQFPQITKLSRAAPLSRSTVYALLFVGWASRVIRFETGSFGYLGWATTSQGLPSRLLQLGDGLLPLVLAAVALELWRSHPADARWHRVVLVGNLVPLALLSLGSGVKGQLLTDLVPIGIVFVISRGRVPLRAFVVLALFVVIEYSGVQVFRTDISTGAVDSAHRQGIVSTVGAVVHRVAHSWSTAPPQDHLRQAWDGVASEYSATIRTLAIILHDTPGRVPFLGVRRLVVAPAIFVPSRALGGVTNVGPYVETTYIRGPPTSSIPPTQPGDFFMSGGWEAVVLGEFVVGIIIGLTWRFVGRSSSPRGWVMYAVLATTFASAGLDWVSLVRTLLEFSIVYLPVASLLFPRRSEQRVAMLVSDD
jgi:hypothetical protein